MATIDRCVIESIPSYREAGNVPPDITVVYLACSNQRTTAEEVLRSCQTPSLNRDPLSDLVPLKGMAYSYAITQTSDTTRETRNVAGIYAFDFDVSKAGKGDQNYRIQVRFRAPRLGVDEEPGDFFVDSEGRSVPGNFYKTNGTAKHVTERPPTAWVEYYDGSEQVQTGYDLGDGQSPVGDGDPRVLIVNGAKQQIKPDVELPTLNSTITIEQHITDGTAADTLNRTYLRTVNKTTTRLRPHILYNNNAAAPAYLEFEPYTLRFLRAEQSRVYQRSWGTYILQTRWDHNPTGWWEKLPNVGDYYVDGSGNIKTFQSTGGHPIRPPCLLNFIGEWVKEPQASDVANYVLNYLTYEPTEYGKVWNPLTDLANVEQWWEGGLS